MKLLNADETAFPHNSVAFQAYAKYIDSVIVRMKIYERFHAFHKEFTEKGQSGQLADDLVLSTVLSTVGKITDDLRLCAVPCGESVFMAGKKYEASLKIEDTARKLYKAKLDAIRAKLVKFVAECDGAAVDVEESVSKEISIERLMQLAVWSETPQFDRSAMQFFTGALFLMANQVTVAQASANPVSLKSLPNVLRAAYSAGKTVAHCGPDVSIPKMVFLTGNPEIAAKMYKLCAQTSKTADRSINLLTQTVQTQLAAAIDVVTKSVCDNIIVGSEFLKVFDVAQCEAANNQIAGAIAKAELIKQKCDVPGLQIVQAGAARDKARAAINRYAIEQLTSRPNFEHPSKGKTLRNQLWVVWENAEKHKLDVLLPEAMQQNAKEFKLKFPREKGEASAEGGSKPVAKRARAT